MSVDILFQLEQVERHLGQEFILRVPRLQIIRGALLCLLGPTGAGKTTLLRMLTGLEKPQRGTITFAGLPWPGSKPSLMHLRRIALVAQRPYLLKGTVLSNVQYGLEVRGIQFARKRSLELLEKLRIGSLAQQSAQTLSGGQIQLVGLARALVLDPEVLLLDEPTANLDPARVALVEDAVLDYQTQQGRTVIWSTHNQFQACRIATEVGLILEGNWIESADTKSFFEAPANERTAQFIQGKLVY